MWFAQHEVAAAQTARLAEARLGAQPSAQFRLVGRVRHMTFARARPPVPVDLHTPCPPQNMPCGPVSPARHGRACSTRRRPEGHGSEADGGCAQRVAAPVSSGCSSAARSGACRVRAALPWAAGRRRARFPRPGSPRRSGWCAPPHPRTTNRRRPPSAAPRGEFVRPVPSAARPSRRSRPAPPARPARRAAGPCHRCPGRPRSPAPTESCAVDRAPAKLAARGGVREVRGVRTRRRGTEDRDAERAAELSEVSLTAPPTPVGLGERPMMRRPCRARARARSRGPGWRGQHEIAVRGCRVRPG